MSTTDTATLDQPGNLTEGLPQAVLHAYNSFAPHLTEERKDALVRELFNALTIATRLHSMAPVVEVLEAWHRTLVLMSLPEFEAAMSDTDGGELLTLEDLKAQLVG